MKIGHAVLSLNPDYGGPAASGPALAAAQGELGHDVVVMTPERPGVDQHWQRLAAGIPVAASVRLKTVSLGAHDWFALLAGRQCATLQRALRVDVLHVHDMWQPFLAAMVLAASREGIPYVISPRGALNVWSLSQKRLKKSIAMAALWRKLLAGAACLHALNESEAYQIRHLGVKAPVLVVPNGAVLAYGPTPLSRDAFRAQHHIAPDDAVVLFLGRLHMKKAVDVLVTAVAQLVDRGLPVTLVVAGPDEGAERSLRDLVGQLRIEGHVRFVGPVYGADKQACLAGADIFCLPSRDEGFSMAVLEAMGAGLPVVLSPNCNFPEVEAAGAGLVRPVEPDSLAEALALLVSDTARREAYGKAAEALVHARYTWRSVAQSMLNAYGRSLIESVPRC